MTDTLLCLDIHKDTVAALVVDTDSKITRVTRCAAADRINQSFAEAIDQIKDQTGFVEGQCLATFGAEFFSFRNVTLPFSERKKIEQTLPFELVDHSPVDINSLLIDFIIARSDSKRADVVAAMISREIFADHLLVLTAAGLNPDNITISGLSTALRIADGLAEDFLLIDIGSSWASLFIVINGQLALVRSLAILPESEGRTWVDGVFIQNLKQTIHASPLEKGGNAHYKVYLSGSESRVESARSALSSLLDGVEIDIFRQSVQPFIKIEQDTGGVYQPELMDRILAHVYKGGKKNRDFNFRKGPFRKKKSIREFRDLLLKIALPLGFVIISAIVYAGYRYSALNAEQESLRQQITAVFQETLPEVTRIVNPIQQLQVKNKEIRQTYSPGGGNSAGHTIIDLLTEISARIPAKYKVKVVRMVADSETVRLKGVTKDFNTVDNVQKDLKKSPYFTDVDISAANQSIQEDEVNFELKLELARK